jgi:ElaB/YqjD/DUF883 family membrane-anchored ribosome-binding protein
MTQLAHGFTVADGSNLVDRAAESADRAIDATRRITDAAIDGVSDKVHELRDRASPALDRIVAPLDNVVRYTQETPVRALLISAAVGASLMAVLSWIRSDR